MKDNDMVNIFYKYIQMTKDYHNIIDGMKFYEKINPIYVYKLKNIKNHLISSIELIHNIQLTRQVLIDFQRIYITNMNIIDCSNISIDYYQEYPREIFHNMTFIRYATDIEEEFIINISMESEIVKIKCNHTTLIFMNEPYHPKNFDKLVYRDIIDCITNYFLDIV